jgi:hypothetical protein
VTLAWLFGHQAGAEAHRAWPHRREAGVLGVAQSPHPRARIWANAIVRFRRRPPKSERSFVAVGIVSPMMSDGAKRVRAALPYGRLLMGEGGVVFSNPRFTMLSTTQLD